MTASPSKGLLLASLLVLLTLPAKAQIGFAGGYALNMANSPSFTSSASNSFEPSGGFNLGMFYDFRFGKVTFRPGAFVRQADFDWEIEGLSAALNPLKSSIRVAEFPLDFLIHFRMETLSPYVVLGPSFNFLHTDQPDLRQTLDNPKGSTSFASFNIGAGLEFQPEGWGLVFFPEIRYGLALSGFMDEDYIVRTIAFSSDQQRISNLVLRLGISLPSY
ncbi:MAG: outer membrane beta-barrel protein [Rhodothermales bacterium]